METAPAVRPSPPTNALSTAHRFSTTTSPEETSGPECASCTGSCDSRSLGIGLLARPALFPCGDEPRSQARGGRGAPSGALGECG